MDDGVTAELLWNCPATRTFHKPDAILASWLDLFLKRMGYENPGCTGNAKCLVVSKLLNAARVTVDFLFGNYGRFPFVKTGRSCVRVQVRANYQYS